MSITTGINGFGRFGLHLLKYWLDRSQQAGFTINYINDDALSLQQALDIIHTDRYVQIAKFYKISAHESSITFTSADGVTNTIEYSNQPRESIGWVGNVDYFLECSGKNTNRRDAELFLKGQTRKVIISATSWDADKTTVFGFNHHETTDDMKIISYGSCTVNAYVPLAAELHEVFGIESSDVNVIHNIQEYKLKDEANQTLVRKFCTLEKSGPNLLGFISKDNFIVNYTIVPYAGVSIIDFRFELKRVQPVEEIVEMLEKSFATGALKHLYAFDETDRGPEVHQCSSYSSIFIRDKVRLLGKSLYLQAYFDNENSVNRYFDLVSYIADEASSTVKGKAKLVKAFGSKSHGH